MRRPEPSDYYRKGDLVMPEPTTELRWKVTAVAQALWDHETDMKTAKAAIATAFDEFAASRPAVGEGLRRIVDDAARYIASLGTEEAAIVVARIESALAVEDIKHE